MGQSRPDAKSSHEARKGAVTRGNVIKDLRRTMNLQCYHHSLQGQKTNNLPNKKGFNNSKPNPSFKKIKTKCTKKKALKFKNP